MRASASLWRRFSCSAGGARAARDAAVVVPSALSTSSSAADAVASTSGRVAAAGAAIPLPSSRRPAPRLRRVATSASVDASAPLSGGSSSSGRRKGWLFDDDDGVFVNDSRDGEFLAAEAAAGPLPSYGCELTAEQWDPLGLNGPPAADDSPALLRAQANRPSPGQRRPAPGGRSEIGGDFGAPGGGGLLGKLAAMVALLVVSRVGVYERLPGVDVEAFGASLRSGGLLGYIDTLSGGSISRVGLFSLGIVPYINASIVLQLLATAFPSLKKLQREEGPQGQARFQLYQRGLALIFAVAQAAGQLSYVRPYVEDWSPEWALASGASLVAGAMILVHIADVISELKIGNGTSILITANIASSLPTSIGAALTQAADKGAAAKAAAASAAAAAASDAAGAGAGGTEAASSVAAAALASADKLSLALYGLSFLATTLGVVYVQEAERKIPINYASRYRAPVGRAGASGTGAAGPGGLARSSYLPFKVNATGVMPVIFASTLLALPTGLVRYAPALEPVAAALGPTGPLYLPTSVALIVFFNYYYTFLQLDPADLAEQLKKQGASIPAVRPGRATAEHITGTLTRMSILGSAFLGALAAAPPLVERLTGLTAFRGFAGTSLLILVGVATDTARKVKAEQAMSKYQDIDKLYDDLKL